MSLSNPTQIIRAAAAALILGLSAHPALAAMPASAPLSGPAFQGLLQTFVDKNYLKAFRHLGDERDFDHGHLLYDANNKLVAILYHTQELAADQKAGSGYDYINTQERNWLQWVDTGRVENAAAYERQEYPNTATWDFFRAVELPRLEARHTILPKMLDPRLLPVDAAKTGQWVFTKVSCAAAPPPADGGLHIVLPTTKEEVCLSLGAS